MSFGKEKPKSERERVEERREEVLAQGRKFKYPMQYAKHKVIINTVIVALVAIVAMVVATWALLYKVQDTGDMIYRLTQVFPVPVAEVEGEKVRYSDYLMIYRSNLLTTEQQGGQLGTGEDADLVRDTYKQAAMNSAIEYTYALKLGKEMGITVSEAMIDEAFDAHRKVGGVERSEEMFLKIVSDNFGMSKTEYRRMLYLTLMKASVTEAIDERAKSLVEQAEKLLAENGGDLVAVSDALGDEVAYEETGRLVDKMNVDGGRANVAMELEVGQVSPKFLSTNRDGYYYVKLAEKTETQVSYASLKINFTTFAERVAQLYADGEVEEYIKIGNDEKGREAAGESAGAEAEAGGE